MPLLIFNEYVTYVAFISILHGRYALVVCIDPCRCCCRDHKPSRSRSVCFMSPFNGADCDRTDWLESTDWTSSGARRHSNGHLRCHDNGNDASDQSREPDSNKTACYEWLLSSHKSHIFLFHLWHTLSGLVLSVDACATSRECRSAQMSLEVFPIYYSASWLYLVDIIRVKIKSVV